MSSIIQIVGFKNTVSGTKSQGLEHRNTISEVTFPKWLFFIKKKKDFGT
jgi:hypothetical protein